MRTASINLRAMPQQRDLIDRASTLLGKTRSDFMLDAACAEAQNVLLDQTLFHLDHDDFSKFMLALEQPVVENAGLKKLLAIQEPWKSAHTEDRTS